MENQLPMLEKDVKKILLTNEQIQQRLKVLAERITEDYKGKDLIVVGILKGSAVFMTDLIRKIDLPLQLDFMVVSSYAGTQTTGQVQILKDLSVDITGKDVLLVEDILDTGTTLFHLTNLLKSRNPASVKIASLLNKPDHRTADIDLEYEGFVIPDEFVIGYGLDYDEKYRNLPYIGVLKEEVYMNKE